DLWCCRRLAGTKRGGHDLSIDAVEDVERHHAVVAHVRVE
ncbi:MAG: hypothetical protein ACI8T1_005035, partial [Verrucomicrobiales bacterium]